MVFMDTDSTRHPLCQRYLQLREELEAAYAAAVWDSQCIDRIAGQMLSVERALAATQSAPPPYGGAALYGAPEHAVRLSSF